jgi:hypothetical protein
MSVMPNLLPAAHLAVMHLRHLGHRHLGGETGLHFARAVCGASKQTASAPFVRLVLHHHPGMHQHGDLRPARSRAGGAENAVHWSPGSDVSRIGIVHERYAPPGAPPVVPLRYFMSWPFMSVGLPFIGLSPAG